MSFDGVGKTEPGSFLATALDVARRARWRHGLVEFDEWDLVGYLWLKYGARSPAPTKTYMRLALLSYAYGERRKTRLWYSNPEGARIDVSSAQMEDVNDSDNRLRWDPVARPDDRERWLPRPELCHGLFRASEVSRSEERGRRWLIVRGLAGGLEHAHVARSLGVARNTVSSTIRLMREAAERRLAGESVTSGAAKCIQSWAGEAGGGGGRC